MHKASVYPSNYYHVADGQDQDQEEEEDINFFDDPRLVQLLIKKGGNTRVAKKI